MFFRKFDKGIIILLLLTVFISCNNSSIKPSDNSEGSQVNQPQSLIKINAKINENPDNADLYNERAKIYLDIKQLDPAISDINKAISINANKSSFYCTLSDIYFAKGKVLKCSEALEKAISLDAKNTEALLKIAELNFFFKKYNKTFEYINKTLDIDKINPKAYFMRGMAFKEFGDTNRAVADFQTATEQDPDNFEAYMQLGLIFTAKKKKIALDYFNNALNIQPKSIEVRYGQAMFYQENGFYNEAIETYTAITQVDPKYKFAYYNLGYIHLVYLKVYNVAKDYFTKAINCDPEYFEAYYNRGYCYEILGDINNSRVDYKKALEINNNYNKAIEGLNRLDKLMRK